MRGEGKREEKLILSLFDLTPHKLHSGKQQRDAALSERGDEAERSKKG